MAEDKKKKEEEEKAQQMAKKQQERKALVKISHEAQPPATTVEEPAVPAPLPKKISSQVSAWCSGIHIQDSCPNRNLKFPNLWSKIKHRLPPVLSKCYISALPAFRNISFYVIGPHIYTRLLEWARFSHYNRSLISIAQ